MSRKKKVLLVFGWLFAIFAGSIEALEILSRTSDCFPSSRANAASVNYNSCANHLYTEDAELKTHLKQLSENYQQGILPSQEELVEAVIETDRDSIGGNNGVYCSGVPFVSSDLPMQAKLFVRRHELEHVFQDTLRIQEENFEFAANYASAKEYPIGFLETTIFSIINSRKSFDSTRCYFVSLWSIFKVYFLPFAPPH